MSNIKEHAVDISKVLIDHGHTTYLAGGCVRDHILGKEPKDYDIATEATPNQILELFPDGDTIGAHFGVIMVKRGGHVFEIATFRSDGVYSDNRRPDSVEFTNAEEDSSRRDFTINGIFEDPLTGEIIDYVGGLYDIKSLTIRCIGNASNRFEEDPLRMLRAIRFATTLGCSIDAITLNAITKNKALVRTVSMERINTELVKILESDNCYEGVCLLEQTGILNWALDLYPQVCDLFSEIEGASVEVKVALLIGGAPDVYSLLKRLKFPNKTIGTVVNILQAPTIICDFPSAPLHTRKRLFALEYYTDMVEYYRCKCNIGAVPELPLRFVVKFRETLDTVELPKNFVTGDDIIDRGRSGDKSFSLVLTTLYNLQLDGVVTTRKEALYWLDAIL